MAPLRSWVAALSAVATLSGGAAGAEEAPGACAGTRAIIETGLDRVTHAVVCEGVSRAAEFLARLGADVAIPLQIVVGEGGEGDAMAEAIGTFDARAMSIRLIPLARAIEASRDNPPFGVPMDEELYRSFVAHEAAHAYAHHRFRTVRPTRIAHEYLAYVVQFATMAPPLRARILEAARLDGFGREEEVSPVYHALAPHSFGIKSYLHFLRDDAGEAFLRRVLDDRALRRNF